MLTWRCAGIKRWLWHLQVCLDTGFGIGRIASVLSFAIARALAQAFVTNIDCPADQLP